MSIMLLINHTQDKYIGVTNSKGENVQIGPHHQVEVTDRVGEGLLSNYSHIFHKVETVASQSEALNKDKTALLSSLAVEQESLAIAKAKISTLEADNAALATKYQELKETHSSVKEENAALKLENAQLKDKLAGNKPAKVEAPKVEEPTQASKLAELSELYEKAFGKKVPNNKKSDTEWIANALAKAPAAE